LNSLRVATQTRKLEEGANVEGDQGDQREGGRGKWRTGNFGGRGGRRRSKSQFENETMICGNFSCLNQSPPRTSRKGNRKEDRTYRPQVFQSPDLLLQAKRYINVLSSGLYPKSFISFRTPNAS
jgi:hypothetical protein